MTLEGSGTRWVDQFQDCGREAADRLLWTRYLRGSSRFQAEPGPANAFASVERKATLIH